MNVKYILLYVLYPIQGGKSQFDRHVYTINILISGSLTERHKDKLLLFGQYRSVIQMHRILKENTKLLCTFNPLALEMDI